MQAGGCATGKSYIDSSFLTRVCIKKALHKLMLQQPMRQKVNLLCSLSSCACNHFLCVQHDDKAGAGHKFQAISDPQLWSSAHLNVWVSLLVHA
jgi:hypothetical protein